MSTNIKDFVRKHFSNSSQDDLNAIFKKLDELGVNSVDDMELIYESDLDSLKKVHVKKLFKLSKQELKNQEQNSFGQSGSQQGGNLNFRSAGGDVAGRDVNKPQNHTTVQNPQGPVYTGQNPEIKNMKYEGDIKTDQFHCGVGNNQTYN